jgi:hypothetical protein
LFGFDHPLLGFRGAKYSIVRSASNLPGLLSTHPKHSASSTASPYSTRGFPAAFLYVISHTPSARVWFASSHARHSARDSA